jgi:hypothetical protein
MLFSVFGPAQLGDNSAPVVQPTDPAVISCPRCRRPWDEHESVRTNSRGYLRCPTSD